MSDIVEIARRTLAWKPSPTMALNNRAQELIRKGEDVVNFTVGEPDFEPPEAVRRAAGELAMKGGSKYTAATGLLSLREAIRDKFLADQGLEYRPDQIAVTVGAKHALFNTFYALLDEGDEVLVPIPYWVTYPDQILLAGGVPVFIPTTEETGFKITPEMIDRAASPRTKAIVLNTPSNPSGAVYTEGELEGVVEACLRHRLTIVSDEVYEKLLYRGARHVSPASLSKEAFEATVVIHAVSKSYAMTGWRIGFVASPSGPLMKAIGSLQSQITSNPTTLAQKAAEVALRLPDEDIQAMARVFAGRREVVLEELSGVPSLQTVPPMGAFYVFPDAGALVGREIRGRRVGSVDDLAGLLLDEAGVAVVPGSSFGAPDHFRISFAAGEDRIREGIRRLKELLVP